VKGYTSEIEKPQEEPLLWEDPEEEY